MGRANRGCRHGKVSSPAPSMRYWRTPRSAAAARRSSANRLRSATMARNRPECSARCSSAAARIAASEASGTKPTAIGSAKISGRSMSWCAARPTAGRRMVRLGVPDSMAREAGLLSCEADLPDHRLPQLLLVADVGVELRPRHVARVYRKPLKPLPDVRLVEHGPQILRDL